MNATRTHLTLAVAAAMALACGSEATAQFTPVFFDSFDVSANTSDINAELASREAGYVVDTFGTIDYVTSTGDSATDYRHQMFDPNGFQILQLAEDGFNLPNAPPIFAYKSMVSPDYNFTGTTPSGDIIGKRITLQLDVANYMPARDGGGGVENPDPNAPTYVKAGVTVGGIGTLVDDDDEISVQNNGPISTHFSASFIEDILNGNGAFMQAYEDGATVIDGTGCIGCFLNHTGGLDFLNLDIRIDDPNDGNPWDGVGSTEIRVLVNGQQVTNPNDGTPWTHVVGNGGLTTNYITLYGQRQLNNNVGSNLATHLFDNLTVYAAPATDVPGDYNYDGLVDAADYTVFRDNEGQVVDLPGLDPNAVTPEIDQEDYDYWAANYGGPAPALSAGVPEPSSQILLLSTALLALRRRSV